MSGNCEALMQDVGSGVAAALRAVDCTASEVSAAAFGRLFAPGGAMAPVLTMLLVLRSLLRFEQSSRDDLLQGLRINADEVENAVSMGLKRGWIEEANGRFRIRVHWLPAITRILQRKNLQAR